MLISPTLSKALSNRPLWTQSLCKPGIGEQEDSLATYTSALQQLSTAGCLLNTQARQVSRRPPQWWLHQMTLYLNILGLLDTAHAVPHAVLFLMGAARTLWRAQEASGSPPTTWSTFKAAFLGAFQTLDAKRIAWDSMEILRQRTSVTDYANRFSGLLLEIPHMHPADAIYQFVKGLKPQIHVHVELQRPPNVNDAMRLTQAADSAVYHTRPAYLDNGPTRVETCLPRTTAHATGCSDQAAIIQATSPPQRRPELPLPLT